MKRRYQEIIRLLLILVIGTASLSLSQTPQPANQRDGVFVHISHGTDDPHRLLMAMKMAVTMAEGGKDVLVYCDIEAVKVLVTGGPAVTLEYFPSSQQLLDRLSELKEAVLACPTCMKVAQIDPKSLRSGVSVAQRDLFFSFTRGRILTLDY